MEYIIFAVCNSEITSPNLRDAITDCISQGIAYEPCIVGIEWSNEPAQILFIPSKNYGGVALNGFAEWSVADSVEDLMERFVGNDGKYMEP